MDAKIAEMLGRLLDAFKNFVQVRNYPNTYGDSDTRTLAAAANLQTMGFVACHQRLGGEAAKFLRIMTTQQSTLFFTKAREKDKEIQYREPLAAANYYNFTDEDIWKFRFEPTAYPVTVTFYMSR